MDIHVLSFFVVSFIRSISLHTSCTPALIHEEPMTISTWRVSCVVIASMVADRGDREFLLLSYSSSTRVFSTSSYFT